MKTHGDIISAAQADKQKNFKSLLNKLSLIGERVYIRNLDFEDYGAFAELFADEKVLYYYLPGRLQTYTGNKLVDLLDDWNDLKTAFVFTIIYQQRPIGLITCESVDFDMGHAEIGIALVNTMERGKGLAAEAMTLFINFLFEDLELHRINARIITGNNASFRLFKRLCFRLEGVQREYIRRGSTYLDMNILGLLADEWRQKHCK